MVSDALKIPGIQFDTDGIFPTGLDKRSRLCMADWTTAARPRPPVHQSSISIKAKAQQTLSELICSVFQANNG